LVFFVKREYDYAIRICAYLAGNYRKGPIFISQISEKLFITRPFAIKSVFQLKNRTIAEFTFNDADVDPAKTKIKR
jgi:DNA-binding IscR family transcriptional regulator